MLGLNDTRNEISAIFSHYLDLSHRFLIQRMVESTHKMEENFSSQTQREFTLIKRPGLCILNALYNRTRLFMQV